MTWVVTGGAGYIGAHVVQAFRDSGTDVVVIDDLSSGRAEFVPPDVPFVQVSILDTPTVAATLREHAAVGVVHLAAFKYAGVSVQRPLHTYMQNVVGTLSLLSAMEQAGVGSLVFSSSAAVYGTPDTDLVTEDTPTSPESPYGESKLIGEWLLADQLALAVRGLRGGGGVLGHEVGVRCAVHGSTGGEHERAHPGLLHRGQQAERADDVLHVGVQGTLHAHPGVLEGRKMHDAVRRVLPKRRRHCRGVQVSILDTPTVAATLREHAADGVVHLAAFKYAGVSVQRPLHT